MGLPVNIPWESPLIEHLRASLAIIHLFDCKKPAHAFTTIGQPLQDEPPDEFVIRPPPFRRMPDDGALHLVDGLEVFRERQVVDLADPLLPYEHAPIDDALCQRVMRHAFVPGVTELLLDGDLGVVQREHAQGIGQVGMAFVLLLETCFDVLQDVEMFIVNGVHPVDPLRYSNRHRLIPASKPCGVWACRCMGNRALAM